MYAQQVALIKAMPKLLFRVNDRRHGRNHTLLMASDYERATWRTAVSDLLSRGLHVIGVRWHATKRGAGRICGANLNGDNLRISSAYLRISDHCRVAVRVRVRVKAVVKVIM